MSELPADHVLFALPLEAASGESQKIRNIKILFWTCAVILGFFQTWAYRHEVNPEGIAYLDVGDAVWRNDWGHAINAFWSPLFSGLTGALLGILRPSLEWEATLVHLLNFVIFLGTLAGFSFFLEQVIRYNEGKIAEIHPAGFVSLPPSIWLTVGYSLFLVTSLRWIQLDHVNPDMLVSCLFYLALGYLLQIRMGFSKWHTAALLGLILGLGYLAKTVMFPLGIVMLFIAAFAAGSWRRALSQFVLALLVFAATSVPFIAVISQKQRHFTIGESARVNYLVHVNRVLLEDLRQGETLPIGTVQHAPRRLSDKPLILEFEGPLGGTFPGEIEPSYWYEGLAAHYDFKQQWQAIQSNAAVFLLSFRQWFEGMAVVCLALFIFGKRGRFVLSDIANHWIILVPSLMGLGPYCMVHVESRYVAPYFCAFWLCLLISVRVPLSRDTTRFFSCLLVALSVILMFNLFSHSLRFDLPHAVLNPPKTPQWKIAEELEWMGLQPGDKVASVGADKYYWARLAHVRLVATVQSESAIAAFWSADRSAQFLIYQKLARAGIKAMVTEKIPRLADSSGWLRIGNSDWHVYFLREGRRL